MIQPLPLSGVNANARRAPRAAWSGSQATPRAQRPTRPQKRPLLELSAEVLSGESEPLGGVAGIAAEVRWCLARAGGPAEAAFSTIAQARDTAAAIRLARAYVELRVGGAGA